MIAEILTWLNTTCLAALPAGALVEIGAEAEHKSPVVPSIQVVIGDEAIEWIASRVAREEAATTTTTRTLLYGRDLPVRIKIFRASVAECDASLSSILIACAAGLTDGANHWIRVMPVSAKWPRRTTLGTQNESCYLDVTFSGGLYVDTTNPRILDVNPEPDDQED
jgi:hypothetical protein